MKILLTLVKLILSISYNLRLMEDHYQKVPKEKIKNWERLKFLSKSAQNIVGDWQTITPIKIRKLKIKIGQYYYDIKNPNDLIYEFDELISNELILNLSPIGKGEEQNITVMNNSSNKKAYFHLDDPSEGFYYVSFFNDSHNKIDNEENITLLIFKNELLVGSRKISYELIDTNFEGNFNLTIDLTESVFKEQIHKIVYNKENNNNNNNIIESENLTYSLSAENNSIILTLDSTMKKQFRNFTFYIFNKKDNRTDEASLSFTLIMTHFIVLNPIIFMEYIPASQSQKEVTFEMEFANNVSSLDSNDIRIFIDGYKQLNGSNTFNNELKKVNLTFIKNTTAAKEYYFVYNGSKFDEYRNIYLANYTINGNCQEISDPKDININISYTQNLQGIIDIAIVKENEILFYFGKYSNTSI